MPGWVNAFKRTAVAVQLNCVAALGFGVKRRLLPRREAEGIINQLELVRVHARQLEHPIKGAVICVGGNRVIRNKPLKINLSLLPVMVSLEALSETICLRRLRALRMDASEASLFG